MSWAVCLAGHFREIADIRKQNGDFVKAGSERLRGIGDFPVNRVRHELPQAFSNGDFMDFRPQFAVVEGLGQKSVDAFVGGLNGGFHGGVAGQNDAGNVRELINVLEYALAAAGQDTKLMSKHLPPAYRITFSFFL